MVARAAVVGGAAYYAGKHVQQGRDQGPAQDAPIGDPQDAGAPVQPVDTVDQLSRLAQLHEQGVLTDDEFAMEKQKILGA